MANDQQLLNRINIYRGSQAQVQDTPTALNITKSRQVIKPIEETLLVLPRKEERSFKLNFDDFSRHLG